MRIIGVGEIEACGGRLVLAPGDRLTPLARDRANELGVVIATGEYPATTRAPGGPSAGPHSPEGPADPPVGALYRRGAPVVPDHLQPAVVAGLAAQRQSRATVVGAGHVGATTALRLAEADVFDEVVMLDVVPGLAAGLALDLWHSSALSGFATRLRGTAEIAETAGSDYVVVTAGRARQPGMSRTDLTAANAAIVGGVAEGIREHSPRAVVVVVTNPLDEMTHLVWRTTGFPARRVLGMAGVLDATRFCALAAGAAGVRPDLVEALALGSHGDEMVVPLSLARIGGAPIMGRLDAATLDGLVARTRGSGAEVVALLEKGSAYYAPGAAAARMVLAMAGDTGEVLPCCVLAEGAYGIGDVYLGLPARLGRGGVTEVVELPLTAAEVAELRTAADRIADRVGALTPA
ncbi:MAG TPA: malate dehydrogenase [Acidimicrobiia bacterium]|nr:malate dehydrogenase [Acidimicrobiia bacterium]